MRKINPQQNDTPFYQVVVVFIMLSLLCTTTVRAYADDPTGLTQVIQQLYTALFGNASAITNSADSTGTIIQTTSADTTNGQDPTEPPPPPAK